LEKVVVPIRQGAFRHAQKGGCVGHVAGANQLGGAFEKAFRGMRAFGQERNRWSEMLSTDAFKLEDAHGKLDGVRANGQILDAFP
jgi:hypothetical protein